MSIVTSTISNIGVPQNFEANTKTSDSAAWQDASAHNANAPPNDAYAINSSLRALDASLDPNIARQLKPTKDGVYPTGGGYPAGDDCRADTATTTTTTTTHSDTSTGSTTTTTTTTHADSGAYAPSADTYPLGGAYPSGSTNTSILGTVKQIFEGLKDNLIRPLIHDLLANPLSVALTKDGPVRDALIKAGIPLDEIFHLAGFDMIDGVYHARQDALQQYAGYNSIYDFAFDSGTSMRAAPFEFTYDGHDYTIWAWKGDYTNLGAGAELGI
jgi:hypothetical protein